MKSNFHKKLYCEHKFERRWCCPNNRLKWIRNDKHYEEKAIRNHNKKETREVLNDEI